MSYAALLLDVLAQTTQHGFVMQGGARYHTGKAMEEFFAAHVTRLTKVQLPAYAPDFNPIEYLWKNVKKMASIPRVAAAVATHPRALGQYTDGRRPGAVLPRWQAQE